MKDKEMNTCRCGGNIVTINSSAGIYNICRGCSNVTFPLK